MKITSDYPGGNAIIHEIKDNEVLLEQDLKGTSKWWFYWNFKVIIICTKNPHYRMGIFYLSIPLGQYNLRLCR